MATAWTDKVLKGEELYYYTTKIRAKLKEIAEEAASGKEALQEAIDAVDAKVDDNKAETDQALADLEDKLDKATFEPVIAGGAQYSEYYYGGDTYNTYEEAQAAAEAAGDTDPEITHSSEVVTLFDKEGNEIEPSSNSLYLVSATSGDPATETDMPNNYNEYVWIAEEGYELIGSADINLVHLSDEDIDEIWESVFVN